MKRISAALLATTLLSACAEQPVQSVVSAATQKTNAMRFPVCEFYSKDTGFLHTDAYVIDYGDSFAVIYGEGEDEILRSFRIQSDGINSDLTDRNSIFSRYVSEYDSNIMTFDIYTVKDKRFVSLDCDRDKAYPVAAEPFTPIK